MQSRRSSGVIKGLAADPRTITPLPLMNYGLNIRPAAALDFVSLGALVNRLDPGIIPFRKATHCDIHVSG